MGSEPRLPAVPDVSADMPSVGSATSSLRSSPKLSMPREPVPTSSLAKPSSTPAPGSTSAMIDRPGAGIFGLEKEVRDQPEEVTSKGEHVTDTVDNAKQGMHEAVHAFVKLLK